MRYDQVWPGIITLIKADGTISGVVGTDVREAQTGNLVVPSLEWTFIAGAPAGEMLYRFQVQLDPFTRTIAQLLTVQNRLKQRFHREREWNVGAYWITSRFLAERKEPVRDGIHSGSLDFEFQVVRTR